MPAFTRPKSYDPASQGYFHNSQGHSENYEGNPTEGKHLRRTLRELRRRKEPKLDIFQMEENCATATAQAERMAARVQASQVKLPIFDSHKHSCNGKCAACRSRKKDKMLGDGGVWVARACIFDGGRSATANQQTKTKQKRSTMTTKASRPDTPGGVSLLARGIGGRGRDAVLGLLPPVEQAPREDEEATEEDQASLSSSHMYATYGREEEFDKHEEAVEHLRKNKKWLVTKEQKLADAVTVAYCAHRRKIKNKWEEEKQEGINQDIDPLSLAERVHQPSNASASATQFAGTTGSTPATATKTHVIDQQYLGLNVDQYRAHQRPSSRARQRRLNQVGGPGTDPFKKLVPPPLLENKDKKQETYVERCEANIIKKSQNIQKASSWKKTAIY